LKKKQSVWTCGHFPKNHVWAFGTGFENDLPVPNFWVFGRLDQKIIIASTQYKFRKSPKLSVIQLCDPSV
jgi:hypothetical protein